MRNLRGARGYNSRSRRGCRLVVLLVVLLLLWFGMRRSVAAARNKARDGSGVSLLTAESILRLVSIDRQDLRVHSMAHYLDTIA
jgi:hypothetical protein